MKSRLIKVIMAMSIVAAATSANAYCFDAAAQRYSVDAEVLKAMAREESRMNPRVVRRNANGTVDVGLMGINSVNFAELARYGTTVDSLFNPCVNVMVGAFFLAKKVQKYGMTWEAIGRYHSQTEEHKIRYQRKIYKHLAQAGVVQ